jgi:VCBS repeat-containing protein
MVVFEEYNGIKASEINQNFMYIKNVLEGKNIDANFNTFYSGQVIAKALLEVEFDKLRSMGIEVSNIESNEIKASELNKAFQDMLSAASVANDIPVVSDISISTNEDINYLGVFVVDNITGENNVEIISPPSHGTVIVGLNKSFTYIPQLNYNGSDSFSFSFRVYDGTSYSNIGLVSINVNPVNDMPVAQSISFNLNEDGSYSGNLSASDVDNDILSYSLVSQASKGSVTINSNGSFAYIAGLNQTGNDSFSFKVNDGKSDSNVSVVSITINAVNDAPVANNGSFSVQEDSGLYSDSVIVSDVELSTLTYSLVSSTNK